MATAVAKTLSTAFIHNIGHVVEHYREAEESAGHQDAVANALDKKPSRHATLTHYDKASIEVLAAVWDLTFDDQCRVLQQRKENPRSEPLAARVLSSICLAFLQSSFTDVLTELAHIYTLITAKDHGLRALPWSLAAIVFCFGVALEEANIDTSVKYVKASEEKHVLELYSEIGAPFVLWFLSQCVGQTSKDLDCVRNAIAQIEKLLENAPSSAETKRHLKALADSTLAVHVLEHGITHDESALVDEARTLAYGAMGYVDTFKRVRDEIALEELRDTYETKHDWSLASDDPLLHLRALHIASMHAATCKDKINAHEKLVIDVRRWPTIGVPVIAFLTHEFGRHLRQIGAIDKDDKRFDATRFAEQAAQRDLTAFVIQARWSHHWAWLLRGLTNMFKTLKITPSCSLK